MNKEELLRDLLVAYRNARKRVRSRSYQLEYETMLETRLVALRDRIWEQTWHPLPADVFIIRQPVQREVFASQFEDRVVHHLLYNYLAPVVDRLFIRDSYSCRKRKGTSDAIRRMKHHLAAATHNYRRPAYLLKMDIRGYFMSISKRKLSDIIQRHLDRHWERPADRPLIDYLLREVIFNDVTNDCRFRCKQSEWLGLPKAKSLFNAKDHCGLPIGDLTSQLFSNIYLNELDQYVKRTLHCRHYGRYVDDFYVVSTDRELLQRQCEDITRFLQERLELTVHPNKTILQPADWPVSFLGQYIRPHYALPSKRVIRHFQQAMGKMSVTIPHLLQDMPWHGFMDTLAFRHYKEMPSYEGWDKCVRERHEELRKIQSSLNSYLGLLRHCPTCRLRQRALHGHPINRCLDIDTTFTKGNLHGWMKQNPKEIIHSIWPE